MSTELKEPVAGVVLRDRAGRYLLVQEKQPQAYGLWNLPAGLIDANETPQQTAIREAQEEVGLKVELLEEKALLIALNDNKNRMCHSFRATVKSGKLSPQKGELLAARWLSIDEIERLNREKKIRSQWSIESIRKVEKMK